MECKFVVGQKVVCVADYWRSISLSDPEPPPGVVKGGIYTISKVEPFLGAIMVHLREVPSHRWHHSGFRPLQDRPKEADTDISVFTPALNVKKLEPVP